jgi:hypothetical protein
VARKRGDAAYALLPVTVAITRMSDPEERENRLLRLVDAEPPAADVDDVAGRLDRICRTVARHLRADGVGITLMDMDGRPAGAIAASSSQFRYLEELQFALGEGPCVEAYAARSPVIEPNVAGSGLRRWPGYAPAAHEHGVNAVFAFPIQIGAARLGVLDVYRYEAVPLAPDALEDALGFARICLATLIGREGAGPSPGPGPGSGLGPGGEHADGLGDGLGETLRLSAEAYQAQGFIMVQLGVSLPDAMSWLRAHAFAVNRPIVEVAREVLAGTIVFTREDL